jgi:hypothetical protein
MEKLVGTSQKLRDVKLAEGIASENANAQHLSGLDKQQLAIAKVNEEYVKRSKLAQTFTDAEAYRIFQEESAAIKARETNEIIDKGIEERINKEREASDIRRKNAMDEFQLEIDSQNRKTEAESKAFFEKLERDKQVLEQVKKIEEAEQRLNDLVEERVELEDALLTAKQNQTMRQGELSTMAAGAGGSLRGEGQRKTSSEIGIENAGTRAYRTELRRQAERYDEQIAEDLYIQKKMEGKDGRVSKTEIQNEKQRRVEEAKREEAKKKFEDSTQKDKDKATADLKRNQKEIDKQKGEVDRLKKDMNIGDVHELLSENLKEMRTYALVK